MATNGLFYFLGVLLVFLLGFIDRLREIGTFDRWFGNSVFNTDGFKKKFPRVWKWLKSDNKDEVRYLKIGPVKIWLHPIFWNLYHSMKNLGFALVLIYLSLIVHWTLFFFGAGLIYVAQWMGFVLFVHEDYDK